MAPVKPRRRKARRHNPAAKALRSPTYRPRVVKSKKSYSRKGRPVRPESQ